MKKIHSNNKPKHIDIQGVPTIVVDHMNNLQYFTNDRTKENLIQYLDSIII